MRDFQPSKSKGRLFEAPLIGARISISPIASGTPDWPRFEVRKFKPRQVFGRLKQVKYQPDLHPHAAREGTPRDARR
jgi:hypothetical protein